MFKCIPIKRIYRSKADNLCKDFLIPLLARSKRYDRGVGYFSINILEELSEGLIPYIKNGGIIRIVTSVELKPEDLSIISQGYSIAKDKLTSLLVQEIERDIDEVNRLGLDLICNLIAAKIIEIKVAYLPDGGIYHEKIGLLEDSNGNSIWFTGSPNETYNGYRKNVETLTVIKSWIDGVDDINEQKEYFENLWENKDNSIEVFDFPDAATNKLFSKYRESSDYYEVIKKIEESFDVPDNKVKKLYPYQEDAIKYFLNNNYHGFYEMATGTGKTFTAVKTIQYINENNICDPLYVVILVPQVDLQEQWKREFVSLGLQPYLFGGITESKDWEDDFNRSIIDFYTSNGLIVSICIYDTYFSKIQEKIDTVDIEKMIVVDEAHELSKNQVKKLSDTYNYKLGLSATPERHSRLETHNIVNYFTKGIDTYKYSIDEAIENNFLSHYEYHPIFINLIDEEFDEYKEKTKKLIIELNRKPEEKDELKIQEISNERASIVKKAKNKTAKLNEMIRSGKYNFCNSVVYCGQGKETDTDNRIIDIVTEYLHQGGLKVSQFTSKTKDRTRVLVEFENGYYDTLIAIKCFDQGVDVPKLDKIYILSSDALIRQTIQRRGRVLRKCKETGKEIAYIFDMIALPPNDLIEGIGVKPLVAKEIKRMTEYARLADNKLYSFKLIDELVYKYNITEDSDDEQETYN